MEGRFMENTKDKIYQAAKELIWKNGISKTNVADICEEAGVSNMTFYRKYENKYELLKQIIEENYNGFNRKYEEIFQKNLPFNEKIMELIFAHSELLKGISKKYIDDIAHQDNVELKEFIQKKHMIYNESVLQLLKREQSKGNIRADVDIEFLNFFRNNIIEMLFNPKLQKIYPDTEELIIQLIKMFYFGAVKR
jgi:AcrR family transcriptional regulator